MSASSPTIVVIAGCNGAGKTTFANTFLRTETKVVRFLNADEIARGLSPFAPAALAFRAGKLLITEVRTCLRQKESFALESTLSGRTYLGLLGEARKLGFRIELHYLWLRSADVAVKRVQKRVLFQNGHNVPERDIRRRFVRSLQNLPDYLHMSDHWIIWNNMRPPAKLLASSEIDSIEQLRLSI